MVVSAIPPSFSEYERTKLKSEVKYYIWENPILWRISSDQVVRRCVPDIEIPYVLEFCHSSPFGGHYDTQRTGRKVLDCGLYWPIIFKDAQKVYENCEHVKGQQDPLQEGMKCLNNPCYIVRYLIFGVLILWVISSFFWVYLYFACCRLCLQMGGNHSYKD